MSDYPKIVIFREKHGDGHYIVNSKDELWQVIMFEFEQRKADGWYFDEDVTNVISDVEKVQFMHRRDGYEYEGFEIVQPDEIK